jgi:hypothetical protein
MDTTTITFTSTTTSACILMRVGFSETALSQDANLSANATKGGTTLTLASVPSWVTAGDLIGIDQLDDSSFVSNVGTEAGGSYREVVGNGARGLGQLNRVVSKTATTITVELPLYYSWATAQTAQIFQPGYNPSTGNPKSGCGIEDLTLTASFTQSDGHMIKMENCYGCWVKNVEIDNMAGGVGIQPNFCYRCEFRHNYIHRSHDLGSGAGYGISLYNVSSANLIEDNIVEHVHAGLMAHIGSSGNVFCYNFAFDGTSDSGQNPSISTHGTHTYMNLWEGNFCENKALADWTHGSSSHNTLFRNRITGDNVTADDRACVSIEYYNRYWNVVGNILGKPSLQNKLLSHSGSTSEGSQGSIFKMGGEININNDYSPSDVYSYTSGMFVLDHANYDTLTSTNGGIRWESSVADHALPNSYIYTTKPSYWGGMPWPTFNPSNGATIAANTKSYTNIPAGFRYEFGVDPAAGGDSTPPSVSSATVGTSGTTLSVQFSEAVTDGNGSGTWTLSMSGGSAAATYSSGGGTSLLVYNLNRTVNSSETGTAAFVQAGNGVEDLSGNDLASFSGLNVVNSSTQDTVAPTADVATVNSSGTTLTLTLSEVCTFGAGGANGFTVALSGGSVTATYSSGTGTSSILFNLNRQIFSGEGGTMAYTQPGTGWKDAAGNNLATFSGLSIANSSSLTTPTKKSRGRRR